LQALSSVLSNGRFRFTFRPWETDKDGRQGRITTQTGIDTQAFAGMLPAGAVRCGYGCPFPAHLPEQLPRANPCLPAADELSATTAPHGRTTHTWRRCYLDGGGAVQSARCGLRQSLPGGYPDHCSQLGRTADRQTQPAAGVPDRYQDRSTEKQRRCLEFLTVATGACCKKIICRRIVYFEFGRQGRFCAGQWPGGRGACAVAFQSDHKRIKRLPDGTHL